jgi:hypothetical protein
MLAATFAGTGLVGDRAAVAQDFHVDTTVEAVTPRETKQMSRSVTLFHAGKTYDFIQDMGELVVFDPAHDQFTLLNTQQRRATRVHEDEINRMVQMGEQALANYVKTLRASGKPEAQELVDALLFQFHPQFAQKTTQTDRGPLIDLDSNYFHYQVLGAPPPTPAHGAAYLNYADWIIRLNYVLNPGKTLPEQRIKLDAALRQAQLIPIEVTFGDPNTLQVRARHRIYWDLSDRDRELIRQWDNFLLRSDLKNVSFQDYQRSLLLSVARHK